MAVKTSTGLRNAMMVTDSFKTLMDGCTLKIYAGAVPVSADNPAGSLLCTMTVGNDGTTPLTFHGTATNGVVVKSQIESWSGTVSATGTASYYRLETSADDQTQSDVFHRVQGNVDVAGSDMNFTSVALVQNAIQNLDFYSIVLPSGA